MYNCSSIEFIELSLNDKNTVRAKATAWRTMYPEHVRRLVKLAGVKAYAPYGSDLFHPELWNSAHWNWFTKGQK